MFEPSREQARGFLIEAWRKQREGGILTPLEGMAAALVAMHPEYHPLLADVQTALARDYDAASGQANPFLHLSLHLAIEEQLSIDQPPGIRAGFERLAARGDRHRALHQIMECLAATVWEAQRSGVPPDGAAYLDCIRRLG
jgi:hypothetical protein